MTRIEKPVIIVGTGRCGSTMLHRLMALHPDVGWLSTFNEVFPRQAWLSVCSNLYRRKGLSRKIKHLALFPKPYEAYRFWEHFLPGFSRRNRPQTEDDVPDDAIEPVRDIVARILKRQNRRRLLVKVTGWARMLYFDRIFPDALFIFLRRESRSVISSWIQAGWLDVTSGLDSGKWQWGEVPPRYRQVWEELGGGPILSVAVKIQLDLDDICRNIARLPGRCHELQYENLISEPIEQLRAICDFCELSWDGDFEKQMSTRKFYDTRSKWRQYLSEEDGDRVLEFFRLCSTDSPSNST